jgi:hypothetical protein
MIREIDSSGKMCSETMIESECLCDVIARMRVINASRPASVRRLIVDVAVPVGDVSDRTVSLL